MTDPPSSRGDLLMPVSDDKAIHLMEIEAMRGILDNLKRLNDKSEKQTEILHVMDKRLDRIENNKVDETVEKLRERVDVLEADKDRRAGVVSAAEWLSRFGPWLVAAFATIAAIIGWDRAR